MKKLTLLWLDDIRDPLKDNWLVFSPIGTDCEVMWVKSYNEFVGYIESYGLPDAICFDHDLSDYQVCCVILGDPIPEHEKTGMDCAKWLVEYCMDNNLKLPKWNIQSANPVGKENINAFLLQFYKLQN